MDTYKDFNLDNFRSFLLLKKGDRIVYNRRYAVKRFLQFQKKEEWITNLESIMRSLKLQERRYDRYIDFNHFKEFLDYLSNKKDKTAEQTKEDNKLIVALMVLWDTGMRVSPIINLKARDVKKDSDGYYVTGVEKGGKLTNRYLDDHTAEILSGLIFSNNPEDYAFRDKINDEWENWWECYYRMWKHLKITSKKFLNIGFGISFHWTRTSRAKELYKEYKDLLKVKGFLGHKRTATTERYIKEGEVSSAEIIKKERGKWQ